MVRDIKLAIVMASIAAVGAAAQRGTAPGHIDTTTNGATISVSGCLQSRAPGPPEAAPPPLPTPPPTTPATPAEAPLSTTAPGFMLLNATVTATPEHPTPEPEGRSSTGPASIPAPDAKPGSSDNAHPSFLLEGREDDLRRQVGREVEVTGTLDVRTGVASPDATGSARPIEPGSASPPAPIPGTVATTPVVYTPRVHVNAVRVIAPECRGK